MSASAPIDCLPSAHHSCNTASKALTGSSYTLAPARLLATGPADQQLSGPCEQHTAMLLVCSVPRCGATNRAAAAVSAYTWVTRCCSQATRSQMQAPSVQLAFPHGSAAVPACQDCRLLGSPTSALSCSKALPVRVEIIFFGFCSSSCEASMSHATHHRQLLLVLVLLILLHAAEPIGCRLLGKDQFYGILAAVCSASEHLSREGSEQMVAWCFMLSLSACVVRCRKN